MEDVIASLVGVRGYANYYVPVKGSTYGEFSVSEEMINATALDTAILGEYEIVITHEGYEMIILATVEPDMSEATEVLTLSGVLMMEGPFTAVLYDNGYAVIEDHISAYTYDAATGKIALELPYYGVMYYEVTLDEQDPTIGTLELDADLIALADAQTTKVYTFDVEGDAGRICLVNEAAAVIYLDQTVFFVGAYTLDGTALETMGMDWVLDLEAGTATLLD